MSVDAPVHSREVPPEVPGSAGCRDVLCVNNHWITLEREGLNIARVTQQGLNRQTSFNLAENYNKTCFPFGNYGYRTFPENTS